MKCKDCDGCKLGYFKSKPDKHVCISVKEPFIIENIDHECTEYQNKVSHKKVICIINGSGGCGKDTFVDLVSQMAKVLNYSSIDEVKNIAKIIGWNEEKTEKDRKFLSDLKTLTVEYCDMPLKKMIDKINEFSSSDNEILFLHIREPEEIEKLKHNILDRYCIKTILIRRDNLKQITSNGSDKNVFNYNYDSVILNNGTIDDLKKAGAEFVSSLRNEFEFNLEMAIEQIQMAINNLKENQPESIKNISDALKYLSCELDKLEAIAYRD